MKITTTQPQLNAAIQKVIGSVPRKSTIEILTNILLQSDGKSIRLTGSDLEQESTSICECAGDSFEVTIQAQKLASIVKALPDDKPITLEVKDGHSIIKAGRSKFKLSTRDSADYPTLPDKNISKRFQINQSMLKACMRNISYAMAVKDTRFYLNGMFFNISDGVLTLAATDGHRLGVSTCDTDRQTNASGIIPRSSVSEIIKLLDSDEMCEVGVSDNFIRIDNGDTVFSTKLIDGKFPQYQRVIPANNDLSVLADLHEFKSALNRSAIVGDSFNKVTLEIEESTLTVSSKSQTNDEAFEAINISGYAGDKISISFNVKYISDVLQSLDEEKVLIKLKDENSPCLVETEQDGIKSLNVIMPMKI